MKKTEHGEQAALIEWVQLQPCAEMKLLFAIPNGGYRSPVTGARLKAEGVRAGIPDLFLPVARGGFHGLWIEMKLKGGVLSAAQRAWRTMLEAQGYAWILCRSADEAMLALKEYVQDVSYDLPGEMPGKITPHWMQCAWQRLIAGEPEAEVMWDYNYTLTKRGF